MSTRGRPDRRDLVARLLAGRGEALVVSGLGAPSWDVAAAGDDERNFYLWGGMGGAVMVGLGLALAQPRRRVLVLTGDGEMLMGVGALATIGVQQPANLALVVLDNERYGETGGQQTHTAKGVDLTGMARAAGFAACLDVRAARDVDAGLEAALQAPGPVFVAAKVRPAAAALVVPPRDGALLGRRFRAAISRTPGASTRRTER